MKALRSSFCALAALASLSGAVCAQATYPDKPIRLIVAFDPGGATDIIARLVSPKLAEQLGRSVIIDNRGGGGGSVGTEMAARAAPDGYTLTLGTTSTHVIDPVSHASIKYDPVRDFAAISPMASMPYVLVLHPAVPAKSLKEFVALVRSQPGKLNYSSAGTGSLSHLAGEMLKSTAGLQIVHIPYKGGGPASTAILSGEAQLGFNGLAPLLPHAKAGRMRAIAVGSPARSAELPDVPTVAESGYPGFEVWVWQGFFAPHGTPAAVVNRLHSEIVKIGQLPETAENFRRNGADVLTTTPAEFTRIMKSDHDKYSKVIKAAGIRLD
jgi:tripartite-type tricarboxylate transporter receptor subunit TctC